MHRGNCDARRQQTGKKREGGANSAPRFALSNPLLHIFFKTNFKIHMINCDKQQSLRQKLWHNTSQEEILQERDLPGTVDADRDGSEIEGTQFCADFPKFLVAKSRVARKVKLVTRPFHCPRAPQTLQSCFQILLSFFRGRSSKNF